MFEQLPFDVVTLLCREIFVQSQDPAHRLPSKQIIGRRVVHPSAYAGHDPLIVISSVNKRTRDAAEPFLFRSIAFGRTWERIGTDRWEVARRRMLRMLSKSSLRKLVKVFKFECSADAPWDEMKQHGPSFWDAFVKVLKHLRSVETVHLGLFTQELDSCPRIFALPSSRHPASSDAFDDQMVQSERVEKGILGTCIPCANGDTVVALDYELVPLQDAENVLFPNVKTVHLYRSSQWFARHCPNLESYVDCWYTHERKLLLLGQLVLRPSLVRCLKLGEGFSPDLFQDLTIFSALEELSVWIPPGREVWWSSSTTVSLSRLANLRRLCLVKPSSRSLYSSGGKELQEIVERSIIALEQECPSLRYLKVGEFEYVREGGEESFVIKNLVAS